MKDITMPEAQKTLLTLIMFFFFSRKILYFSKKVGNPMRAHDRLVVGNKRLVTDENDQKENSFKTLPARVIIGI